MTPDETPTDPSNGLPITLGPLGPRDHARGVKLAARMFAHIAPQTHLVRLLKASDPDLSLALRRGREIVGVYLARGPNTFTMADVAAPGYDGFRGLRADALAILPSLRGLGYGRLLRAALPALAVRRNYDFVWGAALHALENRADWLKRRILEREDASGIVTIEPVTTAMRTRIEDKAPYAMLAKWAVDDTYADRTVNGRLVVETVDHGRKVPWVVGPKRAYAGEIRSPYASDIEGRNGIIVTASGTFRGETFAGTIAPAPRETITACAVRHVPSGCIYSGKFIHSLLIEQAAKALGSDIDRMCGEFESGFTTSSGRYVDRQEGAWMITGGRPGELDNCLRSEHMPDGLVVAQEEEEPELQPVP